MIPATAITERKGVCEVSRCVTTVSWGEWVKCSICQAPASPAIVSRPFRFRKNTEIICNPDDSVVMLCTKFKTHGISRKMCYDIGVITRRYKKTATPQK